MEGKGLFFFFFFFISRCRWERSHVICPSAPSRSSRFVRVGARPSLVLVLGSRNLEKVIKKRWYTTKNINASYFVSILRKKEDKKKIGKQEKRNSSKSSRRRRCRPHPAVFFSHETFSRWLIYRHYWDGRNGTELWNWTRPVNSSYFRTKLSSSNSVLNYNQLIKMLLLPPPPPP